MKTLSAPLQEELSQKFGPRVAFDKLERMFYSHDVGSLPSLVKPLIGSTLPAGVVQPLTEEQVIQLVAFARTHNVPLVPRGKSTSGYGGVMPTQGGLVVDFAWMNEILAIDAEAMTATVQPGVVWEKLDKELNKQGLALRTYPSSAPSSTVAGWLAQGGVGFGAYEYGSFRENVVACRAVLPNGEVREFSGKDLDLVSDAEGITGLITEVTVRVRRHEPEALWGAWFDSSCQPGPGPQGNPGDRVAPVVDQFHQPDHGQHPQQSAAPHGARSCRRGAPARDTIGLCGRLCRSRVTPGSDRSQAAEHHRGCRWAAGGARSDRARVGGAAST